MAHVQPFNLQLHLVCDVEDLEAAALAIEPLSGTQTLLNCALRLCRQPDPLLQDLAQKTATRAMGRYLDQREYPFRFSALPPELRRQVLEYTDLVTPLCEVEWNPEKGYYLRYSTWECDGSGDCPKDLHVACQFRNCWEHSHIGCFCRRFHAAFSSNCHCWSPPTSLFLVSRLLLEGAQEVFFKRNRFVITPSAGCNHPATHTPNRLEASVFLTDVVPCPALRFLRFLELVFPPFEHDYLGPHEPAYKDWLQTLDHVKQHLSLPALTLRVYMADYLPPGEGGGGGGGQRTSPSLFRAHWTKEQGKTIVWSYLRILTPLARLKGLKGFFAHLAWPFSSTGTGRRQWREDSGAVGRPMRCLEVRIERFVMGDGYDGAALEAKEGWRKSQWLELAEDTDKYGY